MRCVIKDLVLASVNLDSMELDVVIAQQDIMVIHHVKVSHKCFSCLAPSRRVNFVTFFCD